MDGWMDGWIKVAWMDGLKDSWIKSSEEDHVGG